MADSSGNGTGSALKNPHEMSRRVRKAAPAGEVGTSGLVIQSGRVRDEFNPKLRGIRATQTFREMQDNDPIVGSMLYGIDVISSQVTWSMQAPIAPDAVVPVETPGAEPQPSPEAAQWAEFAWSCLNDMNVPWGQFVEAAMSFLPYGWSLFEMVYKIRSGEMGDPPSAYDDGLVGFRKFALRVQESLWEWEFDDTGGIAGMWQIQPQGAPVFIPMDKALLFRTTAARGNPEGRSILRNAYRPWYFKKRIEEIEAIGVERDMAGIPVAGVPPDYLDDDADAGAQQVYQRIADMVRDLKQDEQVGIVFPRELDERGNNLWSLELLSTGGRRQFDTDAVVSRYDQRIAMIVLADFILLGHENVGSKSLGVSKVELFCKGLNAFMDEIASVINRFAIPKLMRVNQVPRDLWPTLTHTDVREVDLDAVGRLLVGAAAVGFQIDPAAENRIRELLDMPPLDPNVQEQ